MAWNLKHTDTRARPYKHAYSRAHPHTHARTRTHAHTPTTLLNWNKKQIARLLDKIFLIYKKKDEHVLRDSQMKLTIFTVTPCILLNLQTPLSILNIFYLAYPKYPILKPNGFRYIDVKKMIFLHFFILGQASVISGMSSN